MLRHWLLLCRTTSCAATKSHEAKLVEKFREDEAHKFDDAVHIHRIGRSHRCVAPVPQLFLPSSSSRGREGLFERRCSGRRCAGCKVVLDQAYYHTGNVECSAQCNATRFGEKLGDRWQYLPKQSALMSWRSRFAHFLYYAHLFFGSPSAHGSNHMVMIWKDLVNSNPRPGSHFHRSYLRFFPKA